MFTFNQAAPDSESLHQGRSNQPQPQLLSRGLGNQARLRQLSAAMPGLQCKLSIGAVDDPLEAEADRVADHVMRMPGPVSQPAVPGSKVLQRKCAECEEEEEGKSAGKLLRHRSEGAQALDGTSAPEAVHNVLGSPAQPLDAAARAFFEPRFGVDFSGVRIHRDDEAGNSAQDVGARAYAVGSDLVFARGAYQPANDAGRRLIAHELAHVVQQGKGASAAIRREPPTAATGSAAPSAPPAPAAAPACPEAPTFVPTSKPPETILGDNVAEFLANVQSQIGDPFTQPVEAHQFDVDSKGKVTKVNMTVEISISRPRYGGGRGSDKDKAIIQKAVELIKDHENQHSTIAKQMFAAAVCSALGKKEAAAEKAITEIVCKTMAKAQEDYDMQHGQIVVIKDSTGAPSDVTTGPVATRPDYGCTKAKAAPAAAPGAAPGKPAPGAAPPGQ